MKYKLVAADMDGTLLDGRGEITPATVEAIRKLAEKEVVFTISTGRPMQGVEKYKELLGLTGPVITYNGAMIVNAKDNIVLFEQGLLREDARKIWELGLRYDTTMCIWAGNRLYGNRLDERIHDYKKLSGVEPVLAEDIEPLLDIGITKILWYDKAERIEEILTLLSPELFTEVSYCTSKPTFLEFFSSKVSKAVAMEKIGELLGITWEEMIAIGDGLNDLSMIQYAGLGVAMGNAAEEVKEHAQFVTATNEEEGVRKVLEKILQEREKTMYKHYDNADVVISLHDSSAEKATFENGTLTFYFLEDGFWLCPEHEENSTGEAVRTDASEVRFHLLSEDAEDDVHCYVFHKKSEKKSVRKRWTVSELVSAINSGTCRLEFLYRYEGGYKELIFSCELWGKKKPYHRECQLWLSVRDVTYCWNEIAECYRE